MLLLPDRTERKCLFLLISAFFAFILSNVLVAQGICWAGSVNLCGSVDDCVTHEIDYLIIAANELEDTSATYFNPLVDTLAQHRADFLDLNVGIVNTDAIAQGNILDWQIRSFIKAVYDTAQAEHMPDGRIGFVLLVGDKEDDGMNNVMVPTHYYSQPTYASDHYYACVTYDSTAENYDDFPDLIIGRLSVGTAQDTNNGYFIELRGAANKTISYDSISRTGWGDTVVLASDSENRSVYFDTLGVVFPNNYSIDEIRGWESWEADSIREAIISSINRGRWIVDFYGHGAQDWWKYESGGGADTVFSVDDLGVLANKGRYPVILALSCQTGRFDNSDSPWHKDCVAEELVNIDTCGAIAYLGASRAAYTSGSEILLKAIHRALFDDHAYFMGEMVSAGKIEYLSKNSGSYNEAHNFNLFGDPAVNIIWDASDTLDRPDLVIAQSQITQISPWPTSVGDTMTIQAVVENSGLDTADDSFTVHFYNGHPDSGGVLIDEPQTIDSLQAWQSDSVQVDWLLDTLLVGYNKIYVLLDSADVIAEIYEDNNLNWNWLGVYLYQEGFPDTVSQVKRSNPAIVDVVGDSDSDILIAGNCWSGDTLTWSFSKYPKLSSPAVGDIDNDGHQEIVISIYPLDPDPERSFDSLFVYQQDSLEYSWGSEYSNVAIFGTPSLAHLDADNTLDIVFALSSNDHDSNRGASCGRRLFRDTLAENGEWTGLLWGHSIVSSYRRY
jgi:hypothetical protein